MEAENRSAAESGDFGFEHVVQTDAMPFFSDGLELLQQQTRTHFNHGNHRTSDRSKLQKKLDNKSSSNFADEHNKQNELQEENSVYDKLYNLTVENGQLRTEIQTVKTDYKLLLEKNNTLVATLETKEQKLLVAELEMKMMCTTTKQNQLDNIDLINKIITEEVISKSENKMMVKVVENSEAKLDLVEQNSNLTNVEMAKQVEDKMKEMADQLEEKQQKFIQENERKFSGIESKVVEKDKKIEQMEKEGKFLEQEMAALEAKVDSLMKQQQKRTSDIVDSENSDKQQQQLSNTNNNQSLLRNAYSLLYYKLHGMTFRFRHATETKMLPTKNAFQFALYNYWDKWNADVTVNDRGDGFQRDVTKSGSQFYFGNVMAKFAYPTFYFEVTVKNLKGAIHIGVSDTDLTTDGNDQLGGISGSCSIASDGSCCYYLENYLTGRFPDGFDTNDTVGCGIAPVLGTELRVFFATKNGEMHGTPFIVPHNTKSKELYPAVSLEGSGNFAGSTITANFGADLANKPFRYNIAEHKF